jgi:hypothetical protein
MHLLTEEALPGFDSLAEGSQDELVQIAGHLSTFTTRPFVSNRPELCMAASSRPPPLQPAGLAEVVQLPAVRFG